MGSEITVADKNERKKATKNQALSNEQVPSLPKTYLFNKVMRKEGS